MKRRGVNEHQMMHTHTGRSPRETKMAVEREREEEPDRRERERDRVVSTCDSFITFSSAVQEEQEEEDVLH